MLKNVCDGLFACIYSSLSFMAAGLCECVCKEKEINFCLILWLNLFTHFFLLTIKFSFLNLQLTPMNSF